MSREPDKMQQIPEIAPSPEFICVDLVDIEGTPQGYIPEMSPSPSEHWVELVNIEEVTGRLIPEVLPQPLQISVDLSNSRFGTIILPN